MSVLYMIYYYALFTCINLCFKNGRLKIINLCNN